MKKKDQRKDYGENWGTIIRQQDAYVAFPNANSPYIPIYALIDKEGIEIAVVDEQTGEIRNKWFEWRDLLIMHQALTRIFRNKPKPPKTKPDTNTYTTDNNIFLNLDSSFDVYTTQQEEY